MADKELGTYKLMIEVLDKAIQSYLMEHEILEKFIETQNKYIDFLKAKLAIYEGGQD